MLVYIFEFVYVRVFVSECMHVHTDPYYFEFDPPKSRDAGGKNVEVKIMKKITAHVGY